MDRGALQAMLAALDVEGVGIYVCVAQDGSVVPVQANQTAADRVGCTIAELLAMPWSETIAEHERPRLVALLGRVLQGERAPAVLQIDMLHRDGTSLPSEVAITQLETPDGLMFVTMTRDRRYLSSLEADRMAVVGALAAGIAHEINNPLTYVLLHLRSLRRSIDEWGGNHALDAARRLDEAYAGTERIRAITRSVMTFAAAPGAPTDVDLGAVVQSALRLARPELESRARVVCQTFPVAAVRGHEPRLGQIVLSMLLFASAGFPGDDPALNRVVVAVEMRDDHVVFEVTDNGTDLSAEELARALDPVHVVRSSAEAPGFGLGIARSIAMDAGGRLVIARRPGGGVTTTLALPSIEAGENPTTERHQG